LDSIPLIITSALLIFPSIKRRLLNFSFAFKRTANK
jgi:hypothetical protein